MPYKIDSVLHRTFLKRIRERRLDLGLTQTAVAERMGITQPSYANIETGLRNPGLEQIEKVAKALEIPVVELLSEETASAK